MGIRARASEVLSWPTADGVALACDSARSHGRLPTPDGQSPVSVPPVGLASVPVMPLAKCAAVMRVRAPAAIAGLRVAVLRPGEAPVRPREPRLP
eukprot:5130871-Alexandrium_andersonii.AAC.1